MNTIVVFLLMTLCCYTPQAFAAQATEYEAVAKELSQTTRLFRELSKRAPAYNIRARRDPMQPLLDDRGNTIGSLGLIDNDLALQGIILSKELKTALINDEFYSEGEMVGSYKILEIKSNGIVASNGTETTFVELHPDLPGRKNL